MLDYNSDPMGATINAAKPIRPRWVFYRMAWYSLITPFIVAAIIIIRSDLIPWSRSLPRAVMKDILTYELIFGFFTLEASFLAGLTSFFALLGSQWRFGWLIAGLGAVASATAGFWTFVVMVLSSMGNNC